MLYGLRAPLLRVFTDSEAVAAAAEQPLLYVAALQPVSALIFVLDGIFVGASDFSYLALVSRTRALGSPGPQGLEIQLPTPHM